MLGYNIPIIREKSLQKIIEVLKELYETLNREMSTLTARERTSFYIFMMILLLSDDLKYFLFIETGGPIAAITLNTSENTSDATCDVNEQSE
jgi:flagellin-specific chaperone FliS